MAFRLSRAYLEYIHDDLVSRLMPFDEPIDPGGYRDVGLLDSAANRPFQSAFCQDVHETLAEKAAALFHSLVCNHCFENGNKRTAVMALDLFLTANGVFLLMNNEDVYQLATHTAEANSRGICVDELLCELAKKIDDDSIASQELEVLSLQEGENQVLYRHVFERLQSDRAEIVNHQLNASDQPT